MNNEINVRTLCTEVYDGRANDKEAISRFLSDTSANASGSILYLYERMDAQRWSLSKYISASQDMRHNPCNELWMWKKWELFKTAAYI